MVGALKILDHVVSHQAVANILKASGLDPSDERKGKTTWNKFIKRHKIVLWATDFFAAEVWNAHPKGVREPSWMSAQSQRK